MISLDISEIYRKAFGIQLIETSSVFPDIKSNIIPQEEPFSWLAIPVLMPVTLVGATYNKLNKGKIETATTSDLRLPDTTLVDFQRQKNIISTPINGGNGTVKEVWSFEDWQIKIYGFIYPTDVDMETQLKNLLAYENIVDAITVNSTMFEMLGIHQIIIKSIDLPQLKGQSNVRPFSLSCESIEPLELMI